MPISSWTERYSIHGKRALITGASKGIGYEICRVFAEAGADIAAVARDPAGLNALQDEIRAIGHSCETIRADLANADACVAAAESALEHFGVIDILVNNAGVALTGSLLEATVADWDLSMAVNLRAPFLLARTLAPKMIEHRAGKIINVSSQTGIIALDDHAAYAASKSGLNALTKTMTAEWARYNIQSNAICPTVILTPMGEEVWGDPAKGQPMRDKTPLRRFGKPVEVADLALYLASPASDLMTGSLLLIDGGFSSV